MSLISMSMAAALVAAIGGTTMETSWTCRTGAAARVVAVREGRLTTLAFRAGRQAAAPPVGPEFRLCLGETPRVLSSDDFTAESRGPGTYLCRGRNGAPDVEVTYAPESSPGVVRKILRVENNTAGPLLLRWAELESCRPGEPIRYAVPQSIPALRDWGQPVFTDHLFFGIEFPAARSTAAPDGSLQLREYPGRLLAPGQSWTSHPAVFGAAAAGDVQRVFLDYIAAISTHGPHAPRPFIYWNGFRVIMPPARTAQGARMIERAREMKRLTGFAFDSWTYDAGFDMYRPDGLFLPCEPDIWKESRRELADIGTPLGFWTSFSCIFDTPTHAWGAKQGYGLQHPAAYCLAEPTYERAIEERLSQIVRENDMRSINFDGMYWGQGYGCNTPGHGHLVGTGDEMGVYGTYAVAEQEMRIFARLRRERPDICMDLFVCNEWASPWWLMKLDGVHTVAGDTVAAGIPSPWLRDELITVRDMQVWELHRHLGRQFPLWAEDLYGNQVRADHLIDGIEVRGEEMGARWEDEFVMAVAARGAIQNHIVCCDLHVLAQTRSGLRFLGEAGAWIRANAPIYRHFALLGGEPAKQEPFGYVHGDNLGRAIVGLRNPSIRSQNFRLRITPDFHLGEPGPYQVTMVYPYRYTWPSVRAGRILPIPLADFQVAILEIRAASRRFEGLPAGRWHEEHGRVAFAGPDPRLPDPWISLVPVASADLRTPAPGGNRPVSRHPGNPGAGPLNQGPKSESRAEDIPGAPAQPPVYCSPLRSGEEPAAKSATAHSPLPAIAGAVLLAEGATGQLQVRVDLPHGTREMSAIVAVDGNEVPAHVHFRDRGASQDAWILADLPTGSHALLVRAICPGPVRMEAWLQYRVQRRFRPTAQPAPRGLFPALDPGEQRATILAMPSTAVGGPNS